MSAQALTDRAKHTLLAETVEQEETLEVLLEVQADLQFFLPQLLAQHEPSHKLPSVVLLVLADKPPSMAEQEAAAARAVEVIQAAEEAEEAA